MTLAPDLPGRRRGPAIRLSVTADESALEPGTSLADEPEVRQELAQGDRASVAGVVASHPSSPLAWTELADIADSEGRWLEAFAFAAVAVEFAREQLASSGWTAGSPVSWRDEPNRAYLRGLDTQRRAAAQLGLDDRAAQLADELAAADAEAPARIASEFTPTQLIPIVTDFALPAAPPEATAGDPPADAAPGAARED